MEKLEVCIKEFNEYSKKYDITNKHIIGKFHHTYRVMEYCKDIAKSINLNEKDINLAMLCGLLHDIARYEQWTKYNTYSDADSVDHGDLACDILKKDNYISKYTKDIKEQQIVLNAVKNHNKYNIENMNEREMLFAKIVRDADKLDIIKEQCNSLTEMIDEPNKDLIDELLDKKQCSNKYDQIPHDHILRELGFIYDFNFKYSYQLIKKEHILEFKIDLLETYTRNIELLEKVYECLKKFINNQIEDEKLL